MSDQTSADVRPHSLSPSAWNRYETCPRMYWLSRQRLPRKAGMAASLGTAVHASVEDLLLNDISHIGDAESGWMPDFAHQVLKARWEEEKAIFLATPRRPQWKEDKWKEAVRNQKGAVMMLLDHVGVRSLEQERVTGALWRRVQKLAIAVEGELKTSDGRLMGRLDLLMGDINDEGQLVGWLVADLKTGRTPELELKTEVNRQLRMYRDILLANNPNAPNVRTEGWYTQNASKWAAKGDNVLEQVYAAWQATIPTPMPMEPTIGESSCGGFCDWKAWLGAPTGGIGVMRTKLYTKEIFPMLLFCFKNTMNHPALPCWNYASQQMKRDGQCQQAFENLLDLITGVKKPLTRYWQKAIKAHCFLAQS